MSTKQLRALVEWVYRGDVDRFEGAKEELEAIERAAKTLADCSVEYIGPVTKEEADSAHDLMAAIAKDAP